MYLHKVLVSFKLLQLLVTFFGTHFLTESCSLIGQFKCDAISFYTCPQQLLLGIISIWKNLVCSTYPVGRLGYAGRQTRMGESVSHINFRTCAKTILH